MTYVGIETQQRNNNLRSILLLILFPMLILGLAFIFFYTIFYNEPEVINIAFTQTIENTPIILGVVAIWFCIAYFFNTSIINSATQSKPLSRTEDKRIYNLVEN